MIRCGVQCAFIDTIEQCDLQEPWKRFQHFYGRNHFFHSFVHFHNDCLFSYDIAFDCMRFLTGGIIYGSTNSNITTLGLYQSLLVYLAHLLNDPLI